MRKTALHILILITLAVIFTLNKEASANHCVLVKGESICNPADPNAHTPEAPTTPATPPATPGQTDGGTDAYEPYRLLSPLPCPEGADCSESLKYFDPSKKDALGKYLSLIIKLIIGIGAVLAVVMIVIGGMEYMTSEVISNKKEGEHKIQEALLGLLVLLGAYALLNTINPDILRTDFEIGEASIEVDLGGESNTPFVPINSTSLRDHGIDCPKNGGKSAVETIGKQFIGKSTYSQTARNTINSSTVYLDCSSFAAQVYACAGLGNPGGTTEAMFSNGARAVTGSTFDFNTLNPGDLIGWRPGDDKRRNGHVMIYLGNGRVLHATSTAGGVTISNLESYKKRITYVKWL